MLPRSFAYCRPDSLEEATEVLGRHPGARPLAGGQSIVNVLKLRAAEVEALVDISRLEELRFVSVEPGRLEIGAGMRYRELAESDDVRGALPVVAAIASRLVDVQVRNRGTIGGNVCYHDPGSNFPPLLVALGATLRLAGPGGREREVAAEEFFVGPFQTALGNGELLRSVVLPVPGDGAGIGYQSLQLGVDSWALARAAAVVRGNGTIEEARVVVSAVGPRPARQRAIEERLRGQAADSDAIERATAGDLEDVDPPSDSHASAEYRIEMARVMARRAVAQALGTKGSA
jgi:aerobic carbon-monoxide dehydrogenase medium subunit